MGLLYAQPGSCITPVPMQRLKGDGAREPPAVERMSTPELEEEKHCGPRNRGLEAIKVRGDRVQGAMGQLGAKKANRALSVPPRAKSGYGKAQWTCVGKSSMWGASSASLSSASSAGSAGRRGQPHLSPLLYLSPWRLYVGMSWDVGGELLGQGLASPWVTLPAGDLSGKQGRGPPVLSPCLFPCDAPALSPPCCQEGPVEPETFLRAAVQGNIRIIEKFLADGGPPDTCDEVASRGHTCVLLPCPTMPAGRDWHSRHWAVSGLIWPLMQQLIPPVPPHSPAPLLTGGTHGHPA